MITITIAVISVGVQRSDALFPRLGPKDPSGVQLSLCVLLSVFLSLRLSVCLYVSPYVFLSIRPRRFLEIKARGL